MNPKRILVRLPNWTGDVVMATPALRALRAGFPKAHITAHVREPLAPLLDGLPHCDAILPLRSWRRGAWALAAEARELKAQRFDLGICFPDSVSSALLMRLARIPSVAGYGAGLRAVLLDHVVNRKQDWGARREIAREHYLIHLVESLGCPSRGTQLELVVDSGAADALRSMLGDVAEKSYVVLAPGAGNGSAKRWPADAFARAAEGLVERGSSVVVCGGPGEIELGRSIAENARCDVIDLSGKVGIAELKALLAGAQGLVCNDAGARHIAVALGTPAVVLFGPTSLAKTDCNLERVVALAADVPCRPCRLRECPIDHRCMRGISAADVVDLAVARFSASAAAAD